MKHAVVAILIAVISATFSSRAQVAAPPTVDLQKQTSPTESPAPTPSNPSDVPELSKLDEAFKQTSLGRAADEYRTRIELRRLQNEAQNDPAVVAAKAAVDSTRTDLDKRNRLRDYYNTYYGRMRARASSEEMRKALDGFRDAHLALLNQPRVRHETDGSLPTPTPSGKHKRKH